MQRNTAILLVLILATGCDYGDSEFNLEGNNYFPMQIGNSWELHAPAQNPVQDNAILKMEITATESFSGVEYYLMVTKWESPSATSSDTVYYRIDENGFVIKRLKTGEISNPFRLRANDGARWRSSDLSTENDTRVTYHSSPVEINSKEIFNCRLFAYDVEGMFDEEHWTTLAPGIGIVTMHSAWGFRRDLKRAIINNIEYDF